jgi:FtsP/CotA-like multicopper oxidase with cupredoxin domain
MHDGRWGNVATVNGKHQPEFSVKPGERVRLRIINGANTRVFRTYLNGLKAMVITVGGRPVSQIFPFRILYLSPGNRVDLDIPIPPDAAGKVFTLEDRFTRNPFHIARVKFLDEPAVVTPELNPPPTAEHFIPADTFENVAVSKSWDLNALRGGKFGIVWGMNQQLWPDADQAGLQLGTPQKVPFDNSSSRLHPMHIHGVFLGFSKETVNQPSSLSPEIQSS